MAIVTDNTLIQPQEITNGGILRSAPQNQGVSPDLFAPHIYMAEQKHVRDVLGKALYANMITEKAQTVSNYNDNCGATLQDAFPNNAIYEAFWVNCLRRLCAYAVVLESLPSSVFEFNNNGLSVQNGDYFDSAGRDGLQVMRKQYVENVNALRSIVETYLCENKDDFPLAECHECSYLYKDCSCKDDYVTKPPKTRMGFFTPASNKKKIRDLRNRYGYGYDDRHLDKLDH